MGSISLYLFTMNVLGFIFMAVDKENARHQKWRIPESTLLLTALAGGSVGAFLGMKICHHKTKHWYFAYGLPLFIGVHAFIAAAWWISKILS